MADPNSSVNGPHMPQPTPLFERLVTEEVQELKAYARIVENQNRRLSELERVHGDLETRLELESRGRVQLEATLEHREREWATKFRELEADRDHWKEIVKVERTKNARLIDQVVRKDQDIHRMLQRKVRSPHCCINRQIIDSHRVTLQYDKKGDSPSSTHPIRNVRQLVNDRPSAVVQQQGVHDSNSSSHRKGEQQFKSPHQILAASGSMEAVRTRNVQNLLRDFFAL